MKLQTKAQLKEIIKQSISEYFEEAGINDILIQLYTRIRKLSMPENKIKNQSKKKKDKQTYDNTAGIKNILKKNNENLSDGLKESLNKNINMKKLIGLDNNNIPSTSLSTKLQTDLIDQSVLENIDELPDFLTKSIKSMQQQQQEE